MNSKKFDVDGFKEKEWLWWRWRWYTNWGQIAKNLQPMLGSLGFKQSESGWALKIWREEWESQRAKWGYIHHNTLQTSRISSVGMVSRLANEDCMKAIYTIQQGIWQFLLWELCKHEDKVRARRTVHWIHNRLKKSQRKELINWLGHTRKEDFMGRIQSSDLRISLF